MCSFAWPAPLHHLQYLRPLLRRPRSSITQWRMQDPGAVQPLRRGQVVDLDIERLAYGGAGVSRVCVDQSSGTGIIVMTKGGLPGDRVRARVKRIRKKRAEGGAATADIGLGTRSYAEAELLSRLREGTNAVKARCKHYGNPRTGGGGCGGCKTMSIAYESQVREKQQQMDFMFRNLENQSPVSPIIKAERLFEYRNKMEFTFGSSLWHPCPPKTSKQEPEFALGLHVSGRFDKVVSIEECHIQESIGNEILSVVRKRCQEALMEPYNPHTHSGFLRHLTIRSAHNANEDLEIMVNFVTSPCDAETRLTPIADELVSLFPNIVCVLQSMTDSEANVSSADKGQRLLRGKRSFIEQKLVGLNFKISAESFFQTNGYQAQVLYEQVKRLSKIRKEDIVLDLFCGTGSIGLYLSKHCKSVVGIEIVSAAVRDAKENAIRNSVENATFLLCDLEKEKWGPKLPFDDNTVDVVVVDPPRAGLHRNLIKYLSRCVARTIVYVSCNPSTQLRDILDLQKRASGQFVVREIQPVDMFPHTPHIESIVAVDRLQPGQPALVES